MKIKFPIITFLILIFSCNPKSETENIDIEISDVMIYLVLDDFEKELLDNEVILSSNKIKISSLNDSGVLSLKVFIDDTLEESFTEVPFSFSIDIKNYSDGAHVFKLEIETIDDNVISKSINIIIDNTGPILKSVSITEGQNICKSLIVHSEIADDLFSVDKVEVFFDETFINDYDNASDFVFTLDPSNYNIGSKYLKFVMTDEIGNVSKDSVNVNINHKLVSIHFPDNFTRKGVNQFHIILSDSNGEFIQSETHSDVSESIDICAPLEFADDTKYILTFVEEFSNSIYDFFVYSDLTQGMVGNEVMFQPRPNSLTNSILDVNIPFYETGYLVKASGIGYSMVNWKDDKILSGHYTTSYNDELGSNKVFVQYFNKDIPNSYKWAFIENITNVSTIREEDMLSDNVVNTNLGVSGTFDEPHVSIYGFENDIFYNDINGHLIYDNSSLDGFDNVYNYSYPNVFNDMFSSVSARNYLFQGVGTPPSSITVPWNFIDYEFSNNTISFTGLSDYEVGRVRLSNSDLESINVEFIFDGMSTEVRVPKLPEGLFPNNVTNVFNNGRLNKIQAVSENYSNFNSYGDYISNVLVSSTPFYITSPNRQRVFKSTVNPFVPFLLPIREFPYYQRF